MATYFIQNTNSVEDIEQMNNVIDKVNKVNTEATSNIGQLTDLNNKAQELSNNIQQALPINTDLKKNIEIGKPLVQEATSKNTELQASLEKAKEFIDGLDGSQNIPGIRMELTELQNGLKSNQALAYTGSSISANDTLEGRTEGMFVKGRTLQNLWNGKIGNNIANKIKGETTYTIIITNCSKNTSQLNGKWIGSSSGEDFLIKPKGNQETYYIVRRVSPSNANNLSFYFLEGGEDTQLKILILEDDWINKPIPKYFEGIKSFGEAEGNKISILSYTGNLLDIDLSSPNVEDGVYYHYVSGAKIVNNDVFTSSIKLPANTRYSLFNINRHVSYWVGSEFKGSVKNNFTDNVFTTQVSPPYDCTLKVTVFKVNKNSAYCTLGDNKLIPWQPYKKPNKKDILIKEPLRENDIMYEDNGQVKVSRKVKQYLITGNETIIVSKTREKTICFNVNFTNDGVDNSLNVMCNNFLVEASCYSYDVEGFFGTKKGIFCSILKSKLTTPDIEGFKAWLKANPTTIVYQLAEPTVEIVENCVDIDLDTFGEKTYFNILNNIKGSLDFKVSSNIASIVQNTAREVNNIWDVINNLLVPSLIDINKNVAMSTIKNNLK